jgi:serine/threonine protein kinase
MLLCLEFLHSKSILHRDIKPENLVFDEAGYMKVTDLGIARVWNSENAKDTSGTPGYMGKKNSIKCSY